MRTYITYGLAGVLISSILVACGGRSDEESYGADHTAETVTGQDVATLENIPEGLALVNFQLQSQTNRLDGSILNNDTTSYVNVQIAFDLYDSQNQRVGTVRDSTREVQSGESWEFSMTVPGGQAAVRAVPVEVQATPRSTPAGQDQPRNSPSPGDMPVSN